MSTTLHSHLSHTWFRLRYSYWFVPAIMMVASVCLALGLIALDRAALGGLASRLFVAYEGGPDGAREVLSVIAGSMITVAGVVFSITIVALQLASTQFGPRVLRNFMGDRGNQFVLGTFVATFIFSLLILRTIKSEADSVPALSVSVAVLLAVLSLAVLIYFIHHAAISIQAPEIVRTIGKELLDTIDRIYPELADDQSGETVTVPESHDEHGFNRIHPVVLNRVGYIQSVDESLLMNLACGHDLQIELVQGPGLFATPHSTVMQIASSQEVDERIEQMAREAISLGSVRTHEQDVLFAVEQLVEVAIRSLSAAINDPFTAMSCIDWLGVGVIRRLRRAGPESERVDEEGRVRLTIPSVSLEEMLDASFGRLRTYAAPHPTVAYTIIDTLNETLEYARTEADWDAIKRHVEYMLAAAERALDDADHLNRLREAARSGHGGGDRRSTRDPVAEPQPRESDEG